MMHAAFTSPIFVLSVLTLFAVAWCVFAVKDRFIASVVITWRQIAAIRLPPIYPELKMVRLDSGRVGGGVDRGRSGGCYCYEWHLAVYVVSLMISGLISFLRGALCGK